MIMSTTNDNRPIGSIAKQNGKTVIWSGDNYGWQSPASHNKLKQDGKFKVGAQAVDRLGNALQQLARSPIGQRVIAAQREFVKQTDKIPGVKAAERLVDSGMKGDDKLPSSRVAQGGSILLQRAAQRANIDPRIAAGLVLVGGVKVGGVDDAAKRIDGAGDAARAARAANRVPIQAPPHATASNPPRVDIQPGVAGPRPRRQLPEDSQARIAAQRAKSHGDPLSRGRTEAATDPPSRYPHWDSGVDVPGQDRPIIKDPNAGPRKADPLDAPRQLGFNSVDPRFSGRAEQRRGIQRSDQGPRQRTEATHSVDPRYLAEGRRESQIERGQQRLNRAKDRIRVQGDKPIGGKPPTREEQANIDAFFSGQPDAFFPGNLSERMVGGRTAPTFPSKRGKDIADPRYVDANRADAFYAQGQDSHGRFSDDGGFGSDGNPGFYTRTTDVTGEGVGKRGQVGPLKGSLDQKRQRDGKQPLGKSQEADAVNDLIDQYRFPEQYNQIEAADNGGIELPRRSGAVDPRRSDLGPRQKSAAESKHKDNVKGGRRIPQSKPEEAKRQAERERIARARTAAGGKGADDGGVNWKDKPPSNGSNKVFREDKRRLINVSPERSERVSRAASEQEKRQREFAQLIDEFVVLNPEAGDRFRARRGANGPHGQLTRPTGNESIGYDPPSNRTDRVTDPRSTVRGNRADRDAARSRALGLEPEPDKNKQGKKGHTTNWEREGVRNVALPVDRAKAEAIIKRLEARESARTGTPNIGRNVSQHHQSRGTGTGSAPGTGSIRAPRNQNPPRDRKGTEETTKTANDAALEAQRAGDRQSEFTPSGELRGVRVISGDKRIGVNETRVSGRDPAEGGRTSAAKSKRAARAAERKRIEAGPRTNNDGTPHKGDLKAIEKLKQQRHREQQEMERIRAARAKRRGGR